MRSRFHICDECYDDEEPLPSPLSKPFLWGAATSAFQIEGNLTAEGRKPSIWDSFLTDASIGSPDLACNSYYQYRDDIKLLADIGAKAYRFSIAWPRVVPEGVAGSPVNPKAITYYNSVINAALAAGITPVVTLYHWDLPVALQRAYGGWLCTERASDTEEPPPLKIVNDFRYYADVCFREFGDRVKHWATINEPQTIAVDCYEYNWYAPGSSHDPAYGLYPGVATPDGNAVTGNDYLAGHTLLLAHAAAYRLYDTTYRTVQRGLVGLVCNMDWGTPYSSAEADVRAAARRNVFWGGWFWDPIFFGDYPSEMKAAAGSRLPSFSDAERVALRGSMDIFFWNTYSTRYIQDQTYSAVGWTFDQRTNAVGTGADGQALGAASQSSWLQIVPWGAGACLRWIQNRYSRAVPSEVNAGTAGVGIRLYNSETAEPRRLDLFITENGIDVAKEDQTTPESVATQDYQRWNDYYKPYLVAITKAAEDTGVTFVGYTTWALLDNLEWTNGVTCRFGITYINFLDAEGALIPSGGPSVVLKRVPKQSSKWLQQYFEGK